MKKVLTILMIIIGLLIATNSWAVIITGSGQTKEEAINNGLREAVEMYTSSFVYGVTDVENYQVKKDQIVAAASGYVKKYRVIRTEEIHDLILVTMNVTLSEDKIETIIRSDINLVTVEDVLKDYSNISQRQIQMRKLMEMLEIIATRPLKEKYYAVYTGYEVKRITPSAVDLVINTRIFVNPFFLKTYREIIKNLSDPAGYGLNGDVYGIGNNYRIEHRRLASDKYNITKQANLSDYEIRAAITINGNKADECRTFRDNLMVVYSTKEMVKAFVTLFPSVFKQNWEGKEAVIDDKWNNSAIQKSKIIPPEGLPIKVNYRISDVEQIKDLPQWKIELQTCQEIEQIQKQKNQKKPKHKRG